MQVLVLLLVTIRRCKFCIEDVECSQQKLCVGLEDVKKDGHHLVDTDRRKLGLGVLLLDKLSKYFIF